MKKFFSKISHKAKGHLLIELVLVIGLMALIIPALVQGFFASREGGPQAQKRLQATAFLTETKSAVTNVRDTDWSTFAQNGTFHTEVQSNTWRLVAGTQTTNGLTQSVTISNVNRDSAGSIVTTGGTIDPSTKKVDITISWTIPRPSQVTSSLYLTRTDNFTRLETTQTQFNTGTNTGTSVVSTTGTSITNDGQIQLGAGGGADWCTPSLSITALNLPGQGITTAISAVQGRAYTTTGGNSSGDSMDAISITNANPPIAANLSPYNNRKTYGIFGDGSYVYLTSDHPSLTVDIVSASTQPFTSVGSFAASGGGTGDSVYVANNIGYVTAGTRLYTFNLTAKTGSRAQLGSIALAGTGKRVVVVGNYAYVTTTSTSNQLQIINVTNPASMSVVGNVDVNNLPGVDVYVNNTGTLAYLVTTYTAGQNDFFVINTTSKNSPSIVGTYNTSGMNPKGVTVVPGNRAIIVGSGGEQYQVLNVTNPASPSRCGGLTNQSGSTSINAVAGLTETDGDVFAYILTNNSDNEFQIIEGGPGGQFSSSGTYLSAIFDPSSVGGGSYDRAFNRFVATVVQPAQTTIRMQVGVAGFGSNGTCSTAVFSYVGPDGTDTTFYTPSGGTITGLIPQVTSGNYRNPGRCFRYRAFLESTEATQTPIIEDFTVNYSP